MSDDRTPYEGMTLDAVRHLNPGWECWRVDVPMNGWYYAKRKGFELLSAADPEDLHIAILRAEARAVKIVILPADGNS